MENVVVSIFKTESEAYQAFAELKAFRQSEATKVAQIALVKNIEGRITAQDRYDFTDATGDGWLTGGLIGGLIGLFAGPLGFLYGSATGGLFGLIAGDTADSTETGLIDVVSKKLVPGETAVIALVQESTEDVINGYFTKYDTEILRWDVATVTAEVEAALKVQEDLYHQAKAQMKAERKAERQAKIDDFKAKVKAKFDNLSSK